MVSMKTIADKLNISRTTVSRILNNKMDSHKYKKETIELVRKTAEELGYTSNLVAKSLKLGSTKILSFLVPDIAHPTYISILKAIEKLASEAGYSLLICATEEDTEKEKRILKMLQSRMVDSVIIAPVSYYESLDDQYSYPLICIDRKTKNAKYPAVLFNNEKAAYNATIAMLEKNVKRPLFIAGNPVDYSVMQRLEGFKRALQEYSLTYTEDRIVFGVFNWQTAKNKIN
jgi:LacI family transcriptional regulator